MTAFLLEDWNDGYAAFSAHEAEQAAWLYLLVPYAQKPPASLTLGDVWALETGWALIVRAQEWEYQQESPSAAASTLGLSQLGVGDFVLAWRAEGAVNYQTVAVTSAAGNRQTLMDTRLAFANVRASIPAGATVTLSESGDSLHLARTNQFILDRSDKQMPSLTWDSAELCVSADAGEAAGGFKCMATGWTARTVFLLGQDPDQMSAGAVPPPEVRFWIGGDAPQRIRLPLFDPVDVSAPKLDVDFTLNPALPFDPLATRFVLSASTQSCFASPAGLTTVDGRAVGLAPVSGVGFHFAPGLWQGGCLVYLAPFGQFSLAAPTGPNGAFQLMPGLSGLEYLDAGTGDLFELLPGYPAYGEVTADDGSSTPQLSPRCTTSWVRLTPDRDETRAYHAQPLNSVFYASADGHSLPLAADAKIADVTGSESAFPLAPYGKIFLVPGQASTDDIHAFEHTYLAAARGKILGSTTPPIFSLGGTVLQQKGATPRGLIADIGPAAQQDDASVNLVARETLTPAGQWRRLYLAKGAANTVTLEPNEAGLVDPMIANALMQPDLFLVYNNWTGHPISIAGELDVGGFTFGWNPLDPSDRSMLLVAKLSSKVSLQDFFRMPAQWRDADVLVGDSDAIAAAQSVFDAAMKTAEATPALFDDFLTRIACDPAWTGFVLFQAPIDGNAMPPTLQILLAGIDAPLRAHHVAVDVSALASEAGVPQSLGPSAVAGVISYDRTASGDASDDAPTDYGFFTQSLKVGIASSAVREFHAEIGLAVPRLFGRAVVLEREPEDPAPQTFLLKGVYHVVANVPTVSFLLPDARVFDFTVDPGAADASLSRVLDRFVIESASILPQNDGSNIADTTTHKAQVTLNGHLWFASDPFKAGVDLFSFGSGDSGLPVDNFGLGMTFELNAQGQAKGLPTIAVDYSRLTVSPSADAIRTGGMVGGLPFKLKGIMVDESGLDLRKLGGKPVNVLQLAANQVQKPHFALQFELVIGSLGELSGVHAALTAEMRLGWGPLETTPDADGALVTIQLPGASGGFDNLNVQGMLQLVFGDANLMRVDYNPPNHGPTVPVYAMLFNNVALSVIGIKLPPKVISDLVLFSDPANATGSNLAACLAVRQQ